jgi:hypothetical protein
MLVKGHDMEYPVGTRAQAKLGAAVSLPPLAQPSAAPPANAAAPTPSVAPVSQPTSAPSTQE